MTRTRDSRMLAAMTSVLALTACGSDAPAALPQQPAAPAPTPEPAAKPTTPKATRTHRAAWYEVTLPADATRTGFAAWAEIPAGVADMFIIDPEGRTALSLFRPMPRQDDRDRWTAEIQQMFETNPTRTWEGELDGEQATVSSFDKELRWTLVVDGFGVLVKCLSETPRDEAWFRQRCEHVVASVRLIRPLTDSVPPPDL